MIKNYNYLRTFLLDLNLVNEHSKYSRLRVLWSIQQKRLFNNQSKFGTYSWGRLIAPLRYLISSDLIYTNNINKHFRITFYSAQHYPYICIWVVYYKIIYCDSFQSLNFVENSWNLIYKSNICFVQDPFVCMKFKSLENYFIECLVCEGQGQRNNTNLLYTLDVSVQPFLFSTIHTFAWPQTHKTESNHESN